MQERKKVKAGTLANSNKTVSTHLNITIPEAQARLPPSNRSPHAPARSLLSHSTCLRVLAQPRGEHSTEDGNTCCPLLGFSF